MVAEVAVEAVIGVTPIVATMPARIKFYLGIRKPTATNAETWMNQGNNDGGKTGVPARMTCSKFFFAPRGGQLDTLTNIT